MSLAGGVFRTVGLVLVLLAGAMAVQAAIFAVTGKAPAALVIGMPKGGPAALPAGVSVLSWGDGYAVVTGDGPGYVLDLYRTGSLLVLPYRKNGCLAARSTSASR